jgi:hypothetical protein
MITGRIVKAEESKDGRQNIAITVEFSRMGLLSFLHGLFGRSMQLPRHDR